MVDFHKTFINLFIFVIQMQVICVTMNLRETHPTDQDMCDVLQDRS